MDILLRIFSRPMARHWHTRPTKWQAYFEITVQLLINGKFKTIPKISGPISQTWFEQMAGPPRLPGVPVSMIMPRTESNFIRYSYAVDDGSHRPTHGQWFTDHNNKLITHILFLINAVQSLLNQPVTNVGMEAANVRFQICQIFSC